MYLPVPVPRTELKFPVFIGECVNRYLSILPISFRISAIDGNFNIAQL